MDDLDSVARRAVANPVVALPAPDALRGRVTRLRRRQRRRALAGGTAVAIAAASGAFWAVASVGSTSRRQVVISLGPPTSLTLVPGSVATSLQVAGFVARAERGITGAFSESYSVSTRYGQGPVRHVTIAVAQLAGDDWVHTGGSA